MLTIAVLAFTLVSYASMRAVQVLGSGAAEPRTQTASRTLAVFVLVGAAALPFALIVDFLTLRPVMEYLREVVQVIQDVGT